MLQNLKVQVQDLQQRQLLRFQPQQQYLLIIRLWIKLVRVLSHMLQNLL